MKGEGVTLVVDAARDRQSSRRKFLTTWVTLSGGQRGISKKITTPAIGKTQKFGEKQQLELCETFIGILRIMVRKKKKRVEKKYSFFSTKWVIYRLGIPRPRPPPRARPIPPAGMGGPAFGFSLWLFLMVSSTDKIKQAASTAAAKALVLTKAGSHTKASKLSWVVSLWISTPYHLWPREKDKKQIKY